METEGLIKNNGKEFIEFLYRKGLSNETMQKYAYYLTKFEGPLTQENVNLFLNHFNNSGSRAFLKNLFEMLDITNIKIPKQTGTKKVRLPKEITIEEVNKIINLEPSRRNKIMFAICFQGGLRVSELINIKPLDFNWGKWKEDKSVGELKIIGKGNKERIVYLSPKLMEFIYDYVNDIAYKIKETDKIFNIGRHRFWVILDIASRRALGKHINPHTIRSSCATYLFNEKQWDILELKEYLGHSNISTTEIYTHLNKKKLKEKFEKSFN